MFLYQCACGGDIVRIYSRNELLKDLYRERFAAAILALVKQTPTPTNISEQKKCFAFNIVPSLYLCLHRAWRVC
jgi:hypothetical protein